MSGSGEVWVIDDDQSIRWVLERALGRAGFTVEGFEGGTGVHTRLRQREPDAIISDIRMPDVDGLELLGEIATRYPHLPVVIMTGYSDLDSAVSAYRGGAYEYLPKPFDIDEAVALVTRAVAHNRENANRDSATATAAASGIIGSAPAMQEVFRAIGRLSRSNLTVLITGESGTGKELVAHYLERAASEIGGGPKALKPDVVRYLESLDWPGNVRQLENACRWLTVMASGNEIHLDDLPPELRGAGGEVGDIMDDWEASLRRWAERRLGSGDGALLDDAMPKFETVLIRCALGRTGGHRQEAARLLGWGRNTLTRKIKELALDV